MLNFTSILSKYCPQQIDFLNESKDYTICLPLEILTTIFRQLGHLELSHTLCQVSRLWYAIASQDILWQPWALNLEILKKDMDQERNKELTINKIIQLKQFTKKAEPLLEISVKTAEQFDSASNSLLFKTNPSEEDKQVMGQLCKELNEKLKLSEDIKNGFKGHFLLRRIGLSYFESMEKYAEKLLTHYGSDREWQLIALEYTKENKIEEVKDIFHLSFQNKNSRCSIFANVIDHLCENNQVDQAVQCLKELFDPLSPEELKAYMDNYAIEQAIETILAYLLEEYKQFDIYENLITTYIPSQEKQKRYMINLIENLLKAKQEEKAKQLIDTYSEGWEKNQREDSLYFYSYQMIPIYVKTKNYEQAWRLALKDCSEDKDSLWFLYRAFLDAELPNEAEKVIEKLKLKGT